MADEPRPEVKIDTRSSTTVRVEHVDRQSKPPFGTTSVSADAFKSGPLKGLGTWVVARAIESNFNAALADIRGAGGVATSSGGIRDLGAPVDTTRSSTSFHYTGRAIDLYIYSGMVNPATDPYIVTSDGQLGTWRVFARTANAEVVPSTLAALKFTRVKPPENSKKKDTVKVAEVEVTDRFFDLTAVFLAHEFHRIPAKESFLDDPNAREYGAAEWWHFQDETGLVVGQTTFGSLLRQVRTEAELKGTSPFNAKDKVWNGKTFA